MIKKKNIVRPISTKKKQEKSPYIKITSLAQLKRESKDGGEFFIWLGGVRSSKHVWWDAQAKHFEVINYIDDTEQALSEKEIMDPDSDLTNIGKAIKEGKFYKDR